MIGLAQPARRTTGAILCQFSDLLLTPVDTMRDYYRRSYARMRGYELPTHFMEIPYWIPIVTSMLPERQYQHELLVVDDMEVARRRAAVPDDPVFFLSVMDANLPYALELAETGARIVAGGYVDPREFAPYPNVTYVDGIDRLREVVPGASPAGALDYRLFAGMRCIPRFSLSTGCSFRCAFCTVPTKLVRTPPERIAAEVDAIAELDFRLVFLDDKSFGEASNWEQAAEVAERIRRVNPGFFGFIVQTPPSLARRRGFLERCRELGVRYVEFGVESADDAILTFLRKPFRMRHLYEACEIAADLGLYVIPNLIAGIPGDTYVGTLAWLERYVSIIPVVNINWLALHWGNERGDLGLDAATVADRDQNASDKSWLTPAEEQAGWDAIRAIYELTDSYWVSSRTYAEVA